MDVCDCIKSHSSQYQPYELKTIKLLPLQPHTRFEFVEFLSHTPFLEHVDGIGVHCPIPVKVLCPSGCKTRPQVVLKRQ
jgi:hypothetical protein